MEFQALNLDTINKGVAHELFDAELEKVVKNIDDPNAQKGKRSITMTFEFSPDKEQDDTVRIHVSAKSSLQNNKGNSNYGYFVLNHGKPIIVQDKFKQESLFTGQENVTSMGQALGDAVEKKQEASNQ